MDNFIGGMEGRFRVPITDSIMMWMVHCAMEKAHEKLKSKEGVIARLNEKSKFYELAVMQLEGCLKFVQEETGSFVLETSHAEVLSDLTEIRDRLQGRLKESETAIAEKDRELIERMEIEIKLRQALEVKEKELVSLRANLELERTKSESVEEFIMSNRESEDEDREDEICELKSSVDEQVWKIKQKLEPDYELIDEERNHGIDSQQIERMGSDIDNLKGTLDLAFNKMYNALFLSEMGPIEQKWRWAIEKDTLAVLVKGLMKDFQQNFEEKRRKEEKQVSHRLREHLSDLMKELACLRCELENLAEQIVVQGKGTEASSKSSTATRGKSLSDGENYDSFDSLSMEVEGQMKQLEEKRAEEDGGNYVAKLIKNHESIIQEKSKELSGVKRELREKECSSFKRGKEIVNRKGMIEETISRLNNIIQWNARVCENLGDDGEEQREEAYTATTSSQLYTTNTDKLGMENSKDVCEIMHESSVSDGEKEELQNEITMLKQEEEDANLQRLILEDTHRILLKDLVSAFHHELQCHELWSLVKEDMYENFIKDIANEQNEKIESDRIKAAILEEIHFIVLSEATKDFGFSNDVALVHYQDEDTKGNCLKELATADDLLADLEGTLREDVLIALFREMHKEWNECIENYNDEGLFGQEISWIVSYETIKDIVNTANHTLRELQRVEKVRVHAAVSQEMYKEWNEYIENYKTESLLREEVTCIVFIETIKDVVNTANRTLNELQEVERVEVALREDVHAAFVQEMYKEWNECTENYKKESLLREELSWIVFDETMKDVPNIANHTLSELQKVKIPGNFECTAYQKLEMIIPRVEKIKHQLHELVELVASLRKQESLYRMAFIRRCENLSKAETEVDLLGNQVDMLVGLLQQIYMTLLHHLPVLQQYSGVIDILKLIKKELTGVLAVSG